VTQRGGDDPARGNDASTRQHHAVVDFAHAVVNAVLNRLLHARDSRFVAEAMRDVVVALANAARTGVPTPLQLQFDDTRICHDGRPLDGPSLQARSLLERCARREIAMLSFGEQLTVDELNRLYDLLLLPENVDALDRSNRDATLVACGIRNVRVTLRCPGDPNDRRARIDDEVRAMQHYQDLATALQQNHRLAHRDLELDVDETATAVERTLADIDEPSMLLSLAMQDDVDRFTVGHSVRVALLALQVARRIGASREQLVHVGSAALMHDIGKSKVPQEVLFKQGRLSKDEWAWMAQHPRLGAQILMEQHEAVDERTIGAAFCHHMRPDGGGYPEPAMPIRPSGTSRLIRVCDVFEALTAVRPYKHALTPIEAYAVMFRNERDFDPIWLRHFVRTLGLFPNGTRVQLADGADAIVVDQTGDLRMPRVRLLTGPGGADLPADHPGLLTIGEPFEGRVARIQGIETHERSIHVPDFDADDPDARARTVHHACLSEDPCGDGHGHDDDPAD